MGASYVTKMIMGDGTTPSTFSDRTPLGYKAHEFDKNMVLNIAIGSDDAKGQTSSGLGTNGVRDRGLGL